MSDTKAVRLFHRAFLAIEGEDRQTFLQGLVSNDVNKATPDQALYSAFLTPQGKFLHDFFLIDSQDGFLLETEADRLADFQKRLSLYKLRSKVAIAARPDMVALALIGPDARDLLDLANDPGAARPFAGGVAYVDPRLPDMGVRMALPADSVEDALRGLEVREGTLDLYDRARMTLGLPEGSQDMELEKAILLENGFEELHGVDFQKGCYMGQELTARTKYRGLVRKRLMPVQIHGSAPEPGAILTLDGKEAGEMRSSLGNIGLALVRLEALAEAQGRALESGDARLTPVKPAWVNF